MRREIYTGYDRRRRSFGRNYRGPVDQGKERPVGVDGSSVGT